MIRTAGELIDEIKKFTNNTNNDRFSDADVLLLLNDGQRAIQTIIFNHSPNGNIFSKEYVFDMVAEQNEYDLPDDIFAENSVNEVLLTNFPSPAKRITAKERRNGRGYYLIGRKIYFAPKPSSSVNNGISLIYTYKLPVLESRTDASELPDVCENYLKMYAMRRMEQIDSSTDLGNLSVFTAEEEARIAELFADNSQDTKYIPITDIEFMNY